MPEALPGHTSRPWKRKDRSKSHRVCVPRARVFRAGNDSGRIAPYARGLTWREFPRIAMPQLSLHSPVGDLTISEEDDAIVAVEWGWGRDQTPTPLLKRAVGPAHGVF